MRRSSLAALFLAASASLIAALPAAAQPPFPDRQVRMIMPWPPGGGTDVLGRVFAQRMQEIWGQPVVVDNRPGANGIIGATEAAQARADGYTIVMATADTHGINPAVRPNLSYDAVRDFTPILWISTQPLILCVHPSVQAATVQEFVALAKANPAQINYASWGAGSTAHMAMELFQLQASIELTHTPYRGATPAITDVLAGRVQAIFTGPFSANPYHQQGRLRCLATGTDTRPATAPDYPTFAEAGFPGFRAGSWFGLVAPKGVPGPVLDALRSAAMHAMEAPAVRERIASIGQDPVGGDPEDFTKHMRREIEQWRQVVQRANITLD